MIDYSLCSNMHCDRRPLCVRAARIPGKDDVYTMFGCVAGDHKTDYYLPNEKGKVFDALAAPISGEKESKQRFIEKMSEYFERIRAPK